MHPRRQWRDEKRFAHESKLKAEERWISRIVTSQRGPVPMGVLPHVYYHRSTWQLTRRKDNGGELTYLVYQRLRSFSELPNFMVMTIRVREPVIFVLNDTGQKSSHRQPERSSRIDICRINPGASSSCEQEKAPPPVLQKLGEVPALVVEVSSTSTRL